MSQTKYGVDEGASDDDQKTATETLPGSDGEVRCPQCQRTVLPRESFGGLRVCPVHGTEPFERSR